MKKLDIKKVLDAMKPVKGIKKPEPIIPDGPPIKDMRIEAMNLGSHGAKEYFGDENAT